MAKIYYTYVGGPVGDFLIAGTPTALTCTGFTRGYQQRQPQPEWICDSSPLNYAIPFFEAYFAGEAINSDINLEPVGTKFQQQVWQQLQTIKYGQTASYGEIAFALGNPKASRAIGAANAANHLPIVIPCHRIIGADGSLTGFGGGLDTKHQLLIHEGSFPGLQISLME